MEEQKLRKKVKHSSSSDSSASDGERKTSKKRRREKKKRKEEGKRNEKKKRKKRQYSSGSSENSSSDEEERSKKRRLLKEAKRILKSHKKQKLSEDVDSSPINKSSSSRKALTEDDYYEKNKEFSTWLRDERGLYFSNLSADDTRRLFLEFVQAWNSGKLSERLYGGIQSAARRTNHKWHIKGDDESLIDKEEELEFMKKLERSQKKKFRNEQKDLMDELLPKATGRERLVEKKLMRKDESRMREESPELLRDQDIMGGSDDFKQRLERERAWREKKAMQKNEALKEKRLAADKRESAAMDQFKALVNVSGGKISIPKRVP